MQKISLHTAINIIQSIDNEGKLNTFSLVHGYSEPSRRGDYKERPLCSAVNPSDIKESLNKLSDNSEKKESKTFYSKQEKRVVTIWDIQEQAHKVLKVDLIMQVNDFEIDHEIIN